MIFKLLIGIFIICLIIVGIIYLWKNIFSSEKDDIDVRINQLRNIDNDAQKIKKNKNLLMKFKHNNKIIKDFKEGK